MKSFVMVLLVSNLLFPSPVAAAENVVFCTQSALPPNVFEENGTITGCDVEIIRAVCGQIGATPEFRLLPPKRAIKYVKEGTVDSVFLLRRTRERERFLHYVPEPVMTKRVVIFARKEDKTTIKGLDDLKGRVVSVVAGYSYIPEFQDSRDIKKIPCYNEEQQVRMLAAKRMDAAAAIELPFRFFSRKLGFQDRFEPMFVMSEVPVYVAFSKAAGSRGKALTEKFGRALRELKQEGVVQAIVQRYTD